MRTKKAAVLPAATTNKLHYEAYPKAVPLSSLKEQIGQLLLYLQTPLSAAEQQQYWQQFEITLREYVYPKLNEVQL